MTNRRPHHRAARALIAAGLVVVAMTAAGCAINRTNGSGPVTSETRPIGAFTKIETSYGIGVTVTIGPAQPLQVQAQQNLLPLLSTEVQGDTLRIRGTEEFEASPRPHVVIVVPSLAGISLSGGSQGRVDGLANAEFGISLSGGAGLTATGTAGRIALDGSGGSVAELTGLAAQTVVLEATGGVIAHLQASDEVIGDASGGAQVTVSGDARLNVDTSGGASISHG